MKMNFFTFLSGLKWDFLKNIVLKSGIPPKEIEWVDFNDINSINAFAERIWPSIIKANPTIANMIKQNSSMLGEKQKDVVEVIDSL